MSQLLTTKIVGTYIVFVPDMKLYLERFTLGHEHLEDKELVDDVEALSHADPFRTLTPIFMKICLHLRWVRW